MGDPLSLYQWITVVFWIAILHLAFEGQFLMAIAVFLVSIIAGLILGIMKKRK